MTPEFKSSRLTPIKHEKGILYRSVSQDSLIIPNCKFVTRCKFVSALT